MMFFNKENRTTSDSTCARGCKSCHDCQTWRQLSDTNLRDDEQRKLESIAQSCTGCAHMLQESNESNLPWWEDARSSWLESDLPETVRSQSSFVTIEIQAEPLAEDGIDIDRVSINFLSPSSHPELLGRLGRYDVERVIGIGGMGVVLKAYDSELHRVVAIKVLSEHLANNSSARKRFAREAQAAAAVVHANVIPIFNVETDGKHPFLVMQCVSGGSLQAKVDSHGPLSVAETLRIVKQTAAGLSAAHQQGLVHRDVKPANILLEENVERVLLSDFGLARAVDDASFTRTGVVVGTPHYMSPEQANGVAVQHASDQFSLGSVIYFMLTGHPPFRAQTAMGVLNRICHSTHRPLGEVNSSVPLEVAQLVDRLLSKEPSKRFESAEQIAHEADRLLSALQSGKLRLSSQNKERTQSFSIRSPLNVLTTSVMLLAAVLGVVWMGQGIWQARTDNQPVNFQTASESDEDGRRVPGSISVRELEAVKRQLSQMESEFAEFNQQLSSAQYQSTLLEQSFSSRSATAGKDIEFQTELDQLQNRINSANAEWSER